MSKSIPLGIDLDERVIRINIFRCAICDRNVTVYCNMYKVDKVVCPYCKGEFSVKRD